MGTRADSIRQTATQNANGGHAGARGAGKTTLGDFRFRIKYLTNGRSYDTNVFVSLEIRRTAQPLST